VGISFSPPLLLLELSPPPFFPHPLRVSSSLDRHSYVKDLLSFPAGFPRESRMSQLSPFFPLLYQKHGAAFFSSFLEKWRSGTATTFKPSSSPFSFLRRAVPFFEKREAQLDELKETVFLSLPQAASPMR